MTGFYASFLRLEIGQFSPYFGAISLLKCKQEKNPLEKIQNKSSGDGTPRISVTCRGRTRLETKAHDFLEGCGCFPGSVRGFSRKTPGKSRGKLLKMFPESEMLQILGFSGSGKGKPAGNLGSTLPEPCPHLPCGVFLKSTVPAIVRGKRSHRARNPEKFKVTKK